MEHTTETTKSNYGTKRQVLLIIICWLAYTIAYLGRYGYNANINLIIAEFGASKADAGLVTSFFFFAYGAGQIINGLLCKFYSKRIMISASLILSAGINAAVFFGAPFVSLKFLWLANGIVQSVLWSSLIMVLSENLDKRHLRTAILAMSTTVAAGTFIIYGLSALLVAAGNYKTVFIIASAAMAITGVIWFALYRTAVRNKEERVETVKQPVDKPKGGDTKGFVIALVAIMALFAIIDNLIKDGLHTWVPTILKDTYGLPDYLSILLTLFLPVLGMLGATCAVWLNKKITDYVALCTVFFAVTAILISLIRMFLDLPYWIPVLASFGLITLVMHSVNNVITSMMPLNMRGKVNSGMMAGVLNGMCYVGSTISSYGLGALSDATGGWDAVFTLFLVCSLASAVVGIVYAAIRKIKKRNNS